MSLKSDLIKRISRKNPALGEVVVSQILSVFFLSIVEHISVGCRVELRGFGSFSARSYVFKDCNRELGRSRYRKMYFRPSEKLVKAVNNCDSPSAKPYNDGGRQ
ncbi:HU family DNA-binding protein [Anaplasma bovis]|uniref:HU family DNA-binding protein n=1 Tax=Anaplasma bovis TaxID=186733 RepID=UPI002FEE6EFE